MVQPSRVFTLWQRLYTRFSIEPIVLDEPPGVVTLIQPVSQADELLRVSVMTFADLDLQGAAGGNVPAFIVPEGERWILLSALVPATTANTQLYIGDGTLNQSWEAAGTSQRRTALERFVIDENGGVVGLKATGNAGDAARTIHLFYLREQAF